MCLTETSNISRTDHVTGINQQFGCLSETGHDQICDLEATDKPAGTISILQNAENASLWIITRME
jgi:hypothetical protein